MSEIVNRREMLMAAQALAKTNQPTIQHYENLLYAISLMFEDMTGEKCECVIRVKKPIKELA